MIKRIELVNFMSHRRTVIAPSAGLTVLVGPNNCGKSAIVTALQILAHNDSSTYVCRHGARTVSVTVETSDDHQIEWKREKNSPKYVVDGQLFDRLRNGNYRETLESTLRLNKVECDSADIDIHFGEQKSPVFLIRDSARNAADFFASSSDAGRLMKMQARHKQKSQQAKNDQKLATQSAAGLQKQIKILKPALRLESELEGLDRRLDELQEQDVRLQQLQLLVSGLDELRRKIRFQSQIHSVLQPLPRVPILDDERPLSQAIQQLARNTGLEQQLAARSEGLRQLVVPPTLESEDPLAETIDAICRLEKEFASSQYRSASLSQLKPPPQETDTERLAKTVERLEKLESLQQSQDDRLNCLAQVAKPPSVIDSDALHRMIEQLTQADREVLSAQQQREQVQHDVAHVASAIEEWAKNNHHCPTCGHSVSAEQLMNCRTHYRPKAEADG